MYIIFTTDKQIFTYLVSLMQNIWNKFLQIIQKTS